MTEAEWRTRKTRIDKRLTASGWRPTPFRPERNLGSFGTAAIEEFPTDSGPADYALLDRGDPLAVVEAKKVSLGAHNALVQAQRYARGLSPSPFNFDGYRVPFAYSTNGEIQHFQDLRRPDSYSRRVSRYHTPAALREMLERDDVAALSWLREHPNNHPRLRPYQRDATQAIEQAIAKGKRQMLVAMATGTGKTFTIASQIYRLMKSGAGKRILFLVDRRALAAQAVRGVQPTLQARGLR